MEHTTTQSRIYFFSGAAYKRFDYNGPMSDALANFEAKQLGSLIVTTTVVDYNLLPKGECQIFNLITDKYETA
jgi:hypothetical protein